MGDANPICTLGDYFRPSHDGYRNTIELHEGNIVDFLKLVDSLDLDVANMERMGMRLFQFSLRDQASNWLERLPAGSISTWEDLTTRFLAQFFLPGRTAKLFQIFYDHVNPATRRTIDQSADGKLHDRNVIESWALLEDLALYDNESWNDPRDFAKPVKAISLPQDVLSSSDCHFIELKNQVQCLMEALLALKQHIQVNKITFSCEICSGPQDTQYCMENLEQAFVDYASSRVLPSDTVKNLKLNVNSTSSVLSARDDDDMMFIKIIKKNDDSHQEELEVGENAGVGELEVEYFNVFSTRRNFTYVIDFMIVEDISSIIDPRLSQVVLRKPFVEISNMTHDPPEGVVIFYKKKLGSSLEVSLDDS
ncbi:MAK10-like protein [Tanacetum coccineum]